HISGTVYANAGQAIENLLQILKTAESIIATHEHQVNYLMADIHALADQHLLATGHELDNFLTLLRTSGIGHIREAEHDIAREWDFIRLETQAQINALEVDLEHQLDQIWQDGHHHLSQAELMIEALTREILGMGPKATLRRGFALARQPKGQPIMSAYDAQQAKQFELEFHDGQVPVTIHNATGGKTP
ncbi:MAG: hypothetical protein RLZZ09_1831, partial [Pseudomonadota bacterium]